MQAELVKWAVSTGLTTPAILYIGYHFWKGKIQEIKDKQDQQDERMEKVEAALVAQVAHPGNVDRQEIADEFGPPGASPSDYVNDRDVGSVQRHETTNDD